jgi:hypothetical protein
MGVYPVKCKFIFTKLYAALNIGAAIPYQHDQGQIKKDALAGDFIFCVLLGLPEPGNPE